MKAGSGQTHTRRPPGRASSWLADRRGVTAVEFALVVPVLLLVVFAITEFGRMFWIQNSIQFAVEEAGRYAMVNTSATESQLQTYAQGKIFGMSTSGITFSAPLQNSGGIDYRSITASYDFQFMIPMLPPGTITLSAKSRVPLIN